MSSSCNARVWKLTTSDNQVFNVKENMAVMSETIKLMVENGVAGGEIPLPNVDGPTMAKIIEWWKMHTIYGINLNVDAETNRGELKAWEACFLDVDTHVLFDLIMATDYLNIHDLFERACQKAAQLFICKSPEDIRILFGIPNDFTPEEERRIHMENAWALEI
ncbi:hypothetical protein K2173_018189 [Erythroxylum novogranatense]|uniref:SKP1-like protein n=1 Tax=Erythroxylum novogranatense TaxID=1862640 RepID=A0AAV8TL72_9ROSI|nr:hypothetical protein K2173_018189 [Erythroxylum novogranatense]